MVKYFAMAYNAKNIAFCHNIFWFVLFLLTFDIFEVSKYVCVDTDDNLRDKFYPQKGKLC